MFVGNNENVLTAIITFFALYNFSQFNGEDRLKDDILSEIMNQERAGYRRTCQKNTVLQDGERIKDNFKKLNK